MIITLEISLYPLNGQYDKEIMDFIDAMQQHPDIRVEVGTMSTLLTGAYDPLMEVVSKELKQFFTNHTAVSIIKISNGCLVNEKQSD